MTRLSIAILAVAACMANGSPARAIQVGGDHLKCYKVKDPLKKASYTADLTGGYVPAGTGCVVKVPAKLVCNAVAKTNVQPAPPNPFVSGQLYFGELLVCYKLKCPKGAPTTNSIGDQFGSRATVTIEAANLLCAPANVPQSG